MSAQFASGSSQYLSAALPSALAGTPVSFGFWFYFNTTANSQPLFYMTDATVQVRSLATNGSNGLELDAPAGSPVTVASLVVSGWHYVVGRFASATSQRLAVLRPTGVSAHAASTSVDAFTGVGNQYIGADNTAVSFLDGYIAEFWSASVDVQADGAQLDDNILRQLAYGGPFSVARVVTNLAEYRSFYSAMPPAEKLSEVYWGSKSGQTSFTNNGAVKIGPHPPLPYWHRNPFDYTRTMKV